MESRITDRKIGIEIECVVPLISGRSCTSSDVQQLLAEVLSNQGIPAVARSYTHQPVPSGCKMAIEHDVSLRDESRYAGLRWAKIEAKSMPMKWSEVEETLRVFARTVMDVEFPLMGAPGKHRLEPGKTPQSTHQPLSNACKGFRAAAAAEMRRVV